ncbi:hypothetical protein GcC1_081024 [Golovinomyces cichoracearum]|uniref:Uncharacterized protein n=1 Tax=Golovinomyces cichoracearum TaxID=62708 RepID=A0A420IKI8_9PEZI|nr:hypothetical protein GcC1_081024 [Golovinomyces cichoracearum]
MKSEPSQTEALPNASRKKNNRIVGIWSSFPNVHPLVG